MLCGKTRNSVRPSAMMLPHVGVCGGMPTPRNDRIASIRIADAAMYVACTISGAIVLGRTCRTSSSGVGVPTAIAASTYGSSRIDSTTERTSRTTRGISGTTMATITVREARRRQRHERDREQDRRDRHQAVHEAHDDRVEPAEVSGHEADREADRDADHGDRNADEQRGARAVDHAA